MDSGFSHAMSIAGLHIATPIVADGKLHRFHVPGDRAGSLNGWYVAFDDDLPAGCFGNWKTGLRQTWCMKKPVLMSRAEKQAYNQCLRTVRLARENELETSRLAARQKAQSIWAQSRLADRMHPYLSKKGVESYGLRLYRQSLVLPLRDSSGILHSLQFISTDGEKRFLCGGKKHGCYFGIGRPMGTLCIAEGYATAASIHAATGHAVAVAFDANNLEPVAKALRHKFPRIDLILCADNDTETPGNPGYTKAKKAATSVGARLTIAGGSHD